MAEADDSTWFTEAYLTDPDRLAVLAKIDLLDSIAEASFDRLARLASKLLDTPVALVSLVDSNRQFFKSCVGLPQPWATQRETPLTHSFCQHVVVYRRPLIINDARLDPRVLGNLAVTDLNVVAYLGIPLAIDGHVIGSFCAIDSQPRNWTDNDIAILKDLAESVISEIHLRVKNREIVRHRDVAEAERRRFQVILSSIDDAVIAADEQGTVTFLNPVAEQLCGWTSEEAVGKLLANVCQIKRIENGQTSARLLTEDTWSNLASHPTLIARDGTQWPIDDRTAPLLDRGGKNIGHVLTFREISDRKRSELALREARLRLAQVLSSSLIATWTWNIAEDRVQADESLTQIFPIAPEKAASAPLAEYLAAIHPDDRPRVNEVVNKVLSSGISFDEEYRVVQPDGSNRWVVARGAVERHPDGHPVNMSGVVVDITERKRADARLHESEEGYRNLYNSIDAGFFAARMIYDADGHPVDYRFLAVNPAFMKQTAWFDVVGQTARDFAPNLEARWFERFETIIRTGEPIRFEDSAESLNNRFFEVYGYRVGPEENQTFAILFNDITHRKHAEQERERLLKELREADRRKDEFLAMLAHELRNPLAAISGGMMALKTEPTPDMLDSIEELLNRQTRHLTRLIDDLLDVSRIATGKIILKPDTVELGPIIDRAIDLVRPLVDEKNHTLTVSRPETSLRFVADATRTEQILGNLLTNAAKYTEPGGQIHLEAREVDGEIRFKIRDSGVGIPAEMLGNVFGLFTQLDSSIDRSQGGLGIGLTLVRNLVEMHGGEVFATSEGRGLGSEFTVTLPIGEPGLEPFKLAHTLRRDSTRAGGGRILVVDDNHDTARMTGRVLSFQGYEVKTSNDGLDAIEVARRFCPDVILLDIGLPGMNGYEVATQIRGDSGCQNTIIIAVSGYGEAKARDRSRKSGFHYHLTKPVDFEHLETILAQLPTRSS